MAPSLPGGGPGPQHECGVAFRGTGLQDTGLPSSPVNTR